MAFDLELTPKVKRPAGERCCEPVAYPDVERDHAARMATIAKALGDPSSGGRAPPVRLSAATWGRFGRTSLARPTGDRHANVDHMRTTSNPSNQRSFTTRLHVRRQCSRALSGGSGTKDEQSSAEARLPRRGAQPPRPRGGSRKRSRAPAVCDRALAARVTGRCWITPGGVTFLGDGQRRMPATSASQLPAAIRSWSARSSPAV